ncbi:isochorismatase family protein [Natronoglycomyces albus]|uniref:isochorismatase n=1 Tax=Natronoglycomyces albus TaxID=2811108 RepID=A0A895XQX7_9ACTN|nr:isochorismatase family protein [Natronoglycomyces albus]QSB03978.1 isochorismatase family protein [Natronoglycomyces albus]
MIPPRLQPYPLPIASELPEPKLSWEFDPHRAALLIHDMQEYFLAFYGEAGYPQLVANINRLRSLGLPTIYTAQPPHQTTQERGLLSDRWGPGPDHRVAIIDPLKPHPNDHIITKRRYSAYFDSDLAEHLRTLGRDQLVISGVYAHIGITATALDSFSLGIAPFVVADAIADFNRERHLGALDHLCATSSVVTTTAQLAGPAPLPSVDDVRKAVLALLDEPAEDDENLMDAGLDSIRVMSLIETWKAAGLEVSFTDLAADPTIRGFHSSLVGE